MGIRHRFAGLAAGSLCLVFGLGACGGDGNGVDHPSASQSTPAGTSSAAAATGHLVEGVYRTDPLTADEIRAAGAAAGFSDADVAPFATFFEESVVYEVVLAGGSWTQSAIVDGGAPDVGWRGTYEVTDDGTVVASDECGDITYGYAVAGDVLSLDVLDDECPGPDELIAQTTIYESGPFTHQPDATESAVGTPAGVVQEATSFVVPFTITLADWLDPAPAEELAHFVTWEALDQKRGLRVLSPVEVYRPGQSEAAAPPKDYLTYVLSLANAGAELTDVVDTEVDGRSAKELTVGLAPGAARGSLDGALGCQEGGLDAESCFGPQDDLLLRLVVIDVNGTPVLVWERDFSDAAGAIDYASFDQMVASLRFS